MIPRDFITEWRSQAPWVLNAQVEQDLVISRVLIELFRERDIAEAVAFRGGTALYKLHLLPAARYSEDIDLVQVRSGPIGPLFDLVRAVLAPWLGEPKRQLKDGRANLIYRFTSEDEPPLNMRLKIEINSREHFSQLGLISMPFGVENRWFSAGTTLNTYQLEELLGTKLRALYQRKKGRDLFDLWHALRTRAVDADALVHCFQRYMLEGAHAVGRAQFEQNLEEKRGSVEYVHDVVPLLRTGLVWDPDAAFDLVLGRLVAKLPGAPWKGS